MAKEKMFSRSLFENAGRKGGSVTGPAKRRGDGDPEYYSKLAKRAVAARKAKAEASHGKRPATDRPNGRLEKNK